MSLKLLTKSLAPDKDVFVLLTLSSDRCFKDKTQKVNQTLQKDLDNYFFFYAWLKLSYGYLMCFYFKFFKFLNILGARKDSSWLMEVQHANSLIIGRHTIIGEDQRFNNSQKQKTKTGMFQNTQMFLSDRNHQFGSQGNTSFHPKTRL